MPRRKIVHKLKPKIPPKCCCEVLLERYKKSQNVKQKGFSKGHAALYLAYTKGSILCFKWLKLLYFDQLYLLIEQLEKLDSIEAGLSLITEMAQSEIIIDFDNTVEF